MIDTSYTLLIESIKECGQIYIDCGNKMFGEALIDTGDIIKDLCEEIERINNSSKDDRVITCKECRYMQQAKVNKKGFLICPASGMEITDNDFCSYAEKIRTEVEVR